MKTKSRPSYRSLAIKILFTVLGCGILIMLFRDKIPHVLEHIRGMNAVLFGAALLAYILSNIIVAVRLRMVFAMQGIHFGILRTWGLVYIGYFFNMFMPSSVGGDVAKGYYAYRYSGKKGKSYIVVIMDRLLGLISMSVLCCLSVFLLYPLISNGQRVYYVSMLVLIIGGGIMSYIFFASKTFAHSLVKNIIHLVPLRIRPMIRETYLLIHECTKQPTQFVQAVGVSLLFQLSTIGSIALLGSALNIDASLSLYYIYLPFIYIVSMLPSINGLGVREGAYVYFFSKSIPQEQAFALSLIVDLFLYTCSAIGFLYYVTHKAGSIHDITHSKESA